MTAIERSLDGPCAELEGRKLAVTWCVGPRGHGPRALVPKGEPLPPPGGSNRSQIELG